MLPLQGRWMSPRRRKAKLKLRLLQCACINKPSVGEVHTNEYQGAAQVCCIKHSTQIALKRQLRYVQTKLRFCPRFSKARLGALCICGSRKQENNCFEVFPGGDTKTELFVAVACKSTCGKRRRMCRERLGYGWVQAPTERSLYASVLATTLTRQVLRAPNRYDQKPFHAAKHCKQNNVTALYFGLGLVPRFP